MVQTRRGGRRSTCSEPFDGVALVEEPRESQFLRILEALRTALIFCPVLLTWGGLLLAGRGYRGLLADDPSAANESFLKLWLSDFHGHSRFGLGGLSIATVVLLVLLIACSVTLTVRRDSEEDRQRHERQALLRRLQQALTLASLALVDHSANSSSALQHQVAEVAEGLSQVVDRTRDVTKRVTKSFQHIEGVADRLESTIQQADSVAQTIASSAAQVQDSIIDMGASFGATTEHMAQQHVKALTDSGIAVSQQLVSLQQGVSEALVSAGRNSATLASSAVESATAMRSIEQSIATTVNELGSRLPRSAPDCRALLAGCSRASVRRCRAWREASTRAARRWAGKSRQRPLGSSALRRSSCSTATSRWRCRSARSTPSASRSSRSTGGSTGFSKVTAGTLSS